MNENIRAGLVKARVPAALVAALSAAGSAHAELPAGITTAITAAGTDGVTLVGALAAAGALVFIINKVLKRMGVTLG